MMMITMKKELIDFVVVVVVVVVVVDLNRVVSVTRGG